MKYIKFESEEQAEKVSRLLYSMMSPNSKDQVTVYLFGWNTIKGVTYAEIREDMVCPILKASDSVLAEISKTLEISATKEETAQMESLIKGSSAVTLGSLMPSSMEEVTKEWISENDKIEILKADVKPTETIIKK